MNQLYPFTGFRLEKVIFKDDNFFNKKGETEFVLFDITDVKLVKSTKDNPYHSPYNSIIIGPNGTGKSQILSFISKLFLELEYFKENGKRKGYVSGLFYISYYVGMEHFEVGTFVPETLVERFDSLHSEKTKFFIYKDGIESSHSFQIPETIICSSVLITDKFNVIKNPPESYKYLGIRNINSPNTAGTRQYVRKTIDYILSSLQNNQTELLYKMRRILKILEYKEEFVIFYGLRYKSHFFNGKLTVDIFNQKFNKFYDPEIGFTKRSSDSPSYGVTYYEKNIAKNAELQAELVHLMNNLENLKLLKSQGALKWIEFDLLTDNLNHQNVDLLNHLYHLDLLTYPGIGIKKDNDLIDFQNTSSGEFNFISSLIGIYASIQHNSIVLIDEPEISLHPNWQMKYMSFINDLFAEYFTCHFVIATHSNFLVSDLRPENSSISGLTYENNTNGVIPFTISSNTFGWSADEVLFKVFKTSSTRNHFFEIAIADLITLLYEEKKDDKSLNKIKELSKLLKGFNITENDPLNELLNEAKEFVKK